MRVRRRATLLAMTFGSVAAGGAGFLSTEVSRAGASTSTASITQLGADIDSTTANDYFGGAVAMSSNGSRIAAGSTGNNEGYVRILDWNGTAWTQAGADIVGAAPGDSFGSSIAVSASGSRVAVSATGDNEGYVRVYDLVGSTWTQVGNFDGTATGENFGASVALSSDGSRLAIGATETGMGGPARGQVRVFDWNGSAWVQVGGNLSGEANNDSFGDFLALSSGGSRLAVGAGNNDGNGNSAGHVRVYDLVGSTWTQVGGDIDGEAAGDGSGERVTISADGSRVAIGASQNDGNGADAGHVRVYDLVGGTWTQVGGDIDGEAAGDYMVGLAMSAGGSRLAAGASANDLNVGTQDSGHVRIFTVPTRPAAPTINSVAGSDRSLTVSFTAGSDGGAAITNYKYSTDGITYTAFSPAVTSGPVTITGLTNQTAYAVTLKAVNSLGDSAASNSISGTPTAPAAVTTTTTTTPTTIATTTTVSTSTTAPARSVADSTGRAAGLPATGGRPARLMWLAGLIVAAGLALLGRRRSRDATMVG